MIATMSQTSVLVSETALATLRSISDGNGTSRDATVRNLLERYIEKQSVLARDGDECRVTHISTALLYPRCLNQPGRAPENVRLHRLAIRATNSLLEVAQTHTYRAPGHALGRGHTDYASRRLGDAVTTAISLEVPFTELELADLPHVVEHRVADVLWLLTRAATMTRTEWLDLERHIPDSPPGDLVEAAKARVATFLYESEVDYMWHSPERAAVALRLAHLYLGSHTDEEDASEVLRGRGDALEIAIDGLLTRSPGYPGNGHITPGLVSNAEGRAASRLWVRDRALAHHRLAGWVVDTSPDEEGRITVVDPPGWSLTWEREWRSVAFNHREAPPDALSADLAAGRLLRVDHGSRSAVWPVSGEPRLGPVHGFEHVIAGMRTARPSASVLEIVEACLVGPRPDHDNPDVEIVDTSSPLYLWLDLDEAPTLDLIDIDKHDRLKSANFATNQSRIRRMMKDPMRRWGGSLSASQLRELRAATNDLDLFSELTAQFDLFIGPGEGLVTPIWEWPFVDLRSALMIYDGQVLEAFARCRMKATRQGLHHSMTHAWMKAMWWTWNRHGFGDDADV